MTSFSERFKNLWEKKEGMKMWLRCLHTPASGCKTISAKVVTYKMLSWDKIGEVVSLHRDTLDTWGTTEWTGAPASASFFKLQAISLALLTHLKTQFIYICSNLFLKASPQSHEYISSGEIMQLFIIVIIRFLPQSSAGQYFKHCTILKQCYYWLYMVLLIDT